MNLGKLFFFIMCSLILLQPQHILASENIDTNSSQTRTQADFEKRSLQSAAINLDVALVDQQSTLGQNLYEIVASLSSRLTTSILILGVSWDEGDNPEIDRFKDHLNDIKKSLTSLGHRYQSEVAFYGAYSKKPSFKEAVGSLKRELEPLLQSVRSVAQEIWVKFRAY